MQLERTSNIEHRTLKAERAFVFDLRPSMVEVRRYPRSRCWIVNARTMAFTLVELLVVVAIVAVLAAMLLPALARGRSSAWTVQCAGNLRQLGIATQLYWDENRGDCFVWKMGATNGGTLFWFGWLGPGAEGQRPFDATQGVLYSYLQGRGVEICPALCYYMGDFKLKATGATYGYGYNFHLSAPQNKPPVNVGRIPATEKVLYADAAQVNDFQPPASPLRPLLEEWYYVSASTNFTLANYYPNGHFRHRQRANAAFCDGHVARERFVPGSLDRRLPSECVGQLRPEILLP